MIRINLLIIVFVMYLCFDSSAQSTLQIAKPDSQSTYIRVTGTITEHRNWETIEQARQYQYFWYSKKYWRQTRAKEEIEHLENFLKNTSYGLPTVDELPFTFCIPIEAVMLYKEAFYDDMVLVKRCKANECKIVYPNQK